MKPSPAMLRDYLEVARELAWAAGKMTLRHFQTDLRVEQKSDKSPVTIADIETERFLRQELDKRFPTHAVLGEEQGESKPGEAEWRWVIDPIDGTLAYAHGMPLYAVLLALEYYGKPVLGVMHMPVFNETVYAANGCGCYWNGRPCRVSQTKSLEESLVLAWTTDFERYGKAKVLTELLRRAEDFHTWGGCIGYMLVATGRADVLADPLSNEWDIAPGIPILREAGGMCTDWNGEDTPRGGNALATNGLLHAEMLNLIREQLGETSF